MQELHIDATAMHMIYYCDVCFSKLGDKDQMQNTIGFDFQHMQSVAHFQTATKEWTLDVSAYKLKSQPSQRINLSCS